MAVEPNYRCKQHELYSVAIAGLDSFKESQARFVNFKSKYGTPYEMDFQVLIDAAMDLPSLQGRDAQTEVAGIVLKEKAGKCLENWQALKRYIRDVQAWKQLQKPRLEEAGWMRYDKAAAYNWDYVLQLNHEGLQFINAYSTELQADGNMPALFVTEFESAKNAYGLAFQQLLDKKQDNPEDAEKKQIANNALHDALTDMFDDGQFVMRKEEALKARFTFTRILNKIRKPTTTGGGGGGGGEPTGDGTVKGKVTSKADGTVLVGALVTLTSDVAQTFTTDINGLYDSGAIKNGNYAVTVWEENHEQIETTVTVNGNTLQDFVMDPLV
ncbi:MAG: carboxypeptidase-like regulatory domain-containing protein [Flavobacteriales bacterium]|nr:carboxypeptidase-like regulatory domain-containing protein [Flavobacteriales bacterium]